MTVRAARHLLDAGAEGVDVMTVFRAVSLAVGLALAAAGAARAADPPPAKRCVLYQVGDLKVTVDHGRPLLEARINGAPVRALIDTGASKSLIFRASARTLGLPLSDVRGLRMGGAGGVTQAQSTFLDKLQIAGVAVSHVPMLVAGEGRDAGYDLLLGEDVLGPFDIEFDLKHGAVRLLQPRDCGEADMAYWAAAYDETPITDAHDGEIGLSVKLNGRPVRAILDSGASTSVGTPVAASIARVKLEASDVRGRGVGAGVLTNEVGVLNSFTIGAETIRHARLRFSDLFGATTFAETGSLVPKPMEDEPEMLLGMDFLSSHRVLVSRTRHRLYFTYEGGPVFDTSRPPPSSTTAAAEAQAGAPVRAPPGSPPPAGTPQAAASRSPPGS